MTRHNTKTLLRRVEALEIAARCASPHNKRNPLIEMAITALAGALTPDEVEHILAAAEQSKLSDLPTDLRRRWVESLDLIATQRFGANFGALLTSPSGLHRHSSNSMQKGASCGTVEGKEHPHVR
jgi:hypothetical protein